MGQHAWIDSLSQSARSILKHHPGGSSAELIWTEALRGVEPECAPSGGLPLSTTQCLGEGIDGNLSPTLARTPPQETPPQGQPVGTQLSAACPQSSLPGHPHLSPTSQREYSQSWSKLFLERSRVLTKARKQREQIHSASINRMQNSQRYRAAV